MDSHLDTVLSVYSNQGVRFDALGVIIIQLLPEHESHGRPILDAGLLEQFLREFPLLSQDFAHRNHTIWQDLERSHKVLQLLDVVASQDLSGRFFSQYSKGCLMGKIVGKISDFVRYYLAECFPNLWDVYILTTYICLHANFSLSAMFTSWQHMSTYFINLKATGNAPQYHLQ